MHPVVGAIARITLTGALAGAAFLLGPATPAAANWFGPEKQLTTGSWYASGADISGTKVVYADYRHQHDVGDPNDPETLYDIRVRNLTTGADKLLTPKHDAYGDPQISGNRVIWLSSNGKKWTMWYHNLATGTHKKLPFTSGDYRISGTRVCYTGSDYRIHVYDFSTGKSKAVSPKGKDAGACDISGTTVVWQRSTGAPNFAIDAYNLSTKKLTALTDGKADASLPRIDGNDIVWADNRNGIVNDDIYAYNLATHTETHVTTEGHNQSYPAVSGGRVVYADDRGGDTQLYLRDIATGVEVQVTDSTGSPWKVAIAGSRIVYHDFRTGRMQVYLRTITPPALTASAPKSVAKGVHPMVSGILLSPGGLAVDNVFLLLQYSTNGSTWTNGDLAVTKADGTYLMTGPSITKKTYLRVWFSGTQNFAPAYSNKLTVKVA